MFARVEVAIRIPFDDPIANQALALIETALPSIRPKIRWARALEVHWLDAAIKVDDASRVFEAVYGDPVLKRLYPGTEGQLREYLEQSPVSGGNFIGLERRYRPGVTDNVGRTSSEALAIVAHGALTDSQALRAASGTLWVFEGPELTDQDVDTIAREVLCNALIEQWKILDEAELCSPVRFSPAVIEAVLRVRATPSVGTVEHFAVAHAQPAQLARWNTRNLWALNEAELAAIQTHYRDRLGGRDATDVELEMIAQTWSEHCKHKIFGARIDYREEAATGEVTPEFAAGKIPERIDGVFGQTIRKTTEELARSWCLSVFEDNAGVVALNDAWAFCMKVETHNSPSALDPFGGALTGIVGVNRDILGCGLGARPVLNTDVFCLAEPTGVRSPALPEKLLPPRRILSGVRRGVEHGGNQSGIPTLNGALVFDPRFVGKPLIYCGTGGLLPRELGGKLGKRKGESKEIHAGDRIVMAGGRVGKDGIHGATFSSLALDESSPVSAVQLGDPITQKRLADFLLEARDLGLYRAVTDNGAGGLSSSVGELARLSGGARMDLSLAPTKYPGLKPFEVLISESQERMTFAVPPPLWAEFARLAKRRQVEVADLGEFTASGKIELFWGQVRVGELDLDFLHGGAPKLHLQAVHPVRRLLRGDPKLPDLEHALPRLLSRPNIASKEWLIRQYDHEVQGTSVLKPLSLDIASGRSSPNDAGVIEPLETPGTGIAVGCGLRPTLSDVDPWLMAQWAVDESVRNVLCSGGEWGDGRQGVTDRVLALVDNFCWPDPVGEPAIAAALVRACFGMREAALELGAPLISGKDSMKNDFRGRMPAALGGTAVQISVPPTLLMTCVARVPGMDRVLSAEFKEAGDVVYLIGGGAPGAEACLGTLGSELDLEFGVGGQPGAADWGVARAVYGFLGGNSPARALLRSAHDVSEGGVLVTVAEALFARGLGAHLTTSIQPSCLFSEGFHSVVVSVRASDALSLEKHWQGVQVPFLRLGEVTSDAELVVDTGGAYTRWKTSALEYAWRTGPQQGYWS